MTYPNTPRLSSEKRNLEQQEISFSAGTLLATLWRYEKAKKIDALSFSKSRPWEIAQRQKFLLTEKPRVSKAWCTIDLWVYGAAADGVDGKWWTSTETSTENYLQWLFDDTHPERLTFVKTKLAARAQLETNETQHARIWAVHVAVQHAQEITTTRKQQQEQLANMKQRKTELLAIQAETPWTSPLVTEQVNRQIENLERDLQRTAPEARNVARETQRVQNLFFVVTLEGEKVVYDEHAEALYTAAEEARKSLSTITSSQTERTWAQQISVKDILEERIAQQRQTITQTPEYQQTITWCTQQWLSAEKAKEIADSQAEKAAVTLAIREFSSNIAQWETYGLSAETITQIKNNEALAVFDEVFEKIVIQRYDDITDKNHLDRQLPLPIDPYFEQVTKVAVYENPAIESYLFDTPAKNPLHILSDNNLSEEARIHLLTQILWTTIPASPKEWQKTWQEQEENKDQEEQEQITTYYDDLNVFANKRVRQLLLYQHFRTIKTILSTTDTQWISLQTACNFSFTDMHLDNEIHSIEVPFLYDALATHLRIDGITGQLTIPTLLDRFLWTPSFPDLGNTNSQVTLLEQLSQAATLSNEQLMLCTSRTEVEELITSNVSQKLLSLSHPTPSPEQVATTIEHEQLLANLWWYVDNTHTPKDTTNRQKQVDIQHDDFRVFVTWLIRPQNGNSPLSLPQTRQINKRLKTPEMHKLLYELTKQPYWFEWFLRDSGIYNAWPEKAVAFFDALHQMATSWVAAWEEDWLVLLQDLTKEENSSFIWTKQQAFSQYVYQDKKISKRDE